MRAVESSPRYLSAIVALASASSLLRRYPYYPPSSLNSLLVTDSSQGLDLCQYQVAGEAHSEVVTRRDHG